MKLKNWLRLFKDENNKKYCASDTITQNNK